MRNSRIRGFRRPALLENSPPIVGKGPERALNPSDEPKTRRSEGDAPETTEFTMAYAGMDRARQRAIPMRPGYMWPMPSRILLLAALYLCQGLPAGFFVVALPVLLREAGTSLSAIGWSTFLALPWTLKFLWSPLVERYGQRRTWILTLQSITALFLGTVALYDARSDLLALCLIVFGCNLLASTQDVATDAYAVDLLPDADRGLGNGVQVAAYRAGMIVGGGALLIALESIGWTFTFAIMSAVVALATIPVWRAPEPTVTTHVAPGFGGFFRQSGVWSWLAIIALYKFGEALGTAMVRPWLTDLDYSLSDIGWLLGTGGFTASLMGALAGGAWMNRLGRRRSLVAFGLLQSASVLVFFAVDASGGRGMAAAVLAEHVLSGMATAALFTAMMDACRPGRGATDYTLQAVVVVQASGLGSGLAGMIADQAGYGTAAAVGGVLSCLGALAFLRAQLWKPRNAA